MLLVANRVHSLQGMSSKRYFPNTFFTSPTLFCTLPATFSAVPRSRTSGLPIAFPASSLTFPLASWIRPLILSFVLEFIHLIRASHRVRAGFSVNMLWTVAVRMRPIFLRTLLHKMASKAGRCQAALPPMSSSRSRTDHSSAAPEVR
jgi:hypothetical protein